MIVKWRTMTMVMFVMTMPTTMTMTVMVVMTMAVTAERPDRSLVQTRGELLNQAIAIFRKFPDKKKEPSLAQEETGARFTTINCSVQYIISSSVVEPEPRSRNWIASRSRSRNYELRLRLLSIPIAQT
jgi:hypothetical protein